MDFKQILDAAVEQPRGLSIESKNRIALRSFLLREISRSADPKIRNLVVEYSPASATALLVIPKELAKEMFNAG